MSSLRWSVLGALVALAGCGFDNAEEPDVLEMNTCVEAAECGGNSVCKDGMCMAESADAPLTVMFEVAPARMPGGGDALPFVFGGTMIDGPRALPLSLPLPARVHGEVRDGDEILAADVSFIRTQKSAPFLPAVPVSASTTEEASEYQATLWQTVEYRMVVRPKDGSLPPAWKVFTPGKDERVDLDYAELELVERTFSFDLADDSRQLLVKAVDKTTGETLSSSALLDDGVATLLFAAEPTSYRLVISAEQTYPDTAGLADPEAELRLPCDTQTPGFPVFNIDGDAAEAGIGEGEPLALPTPPTRIRYQGSVKLCSNEGPDGLASLPVSIRSRALASATETPFSGSYSVTTNAFLDEESGEYRFCVELFEGDYDVVVTPPQSMDSCGVFAETRLIRAPDGMAATGALLELPSVFNLTGMLRTNSLQPLPGATVSAVALGRSAETLAARSGATPLDDEDRSLPQFNRSREVVTDADGGFDLGLDLGSYDIVIKPPAESGFPWRVHHDVTLNRGKLTTMFDMRSPLRLEGRLSYKDVDPVTAAMLRSTLDGATVRAYAVLDDPYSTAEDRQSRAVQIGRATADAEGNFTLLLPPMLQEGLL